MVRTKLISNILISVHEPFFPLRGILVLRDRKTSFFVMFLKIILGQVSSNELRSDSYSNSQF